MIDAPIAFAFAGGLVAAFNPCGFAMLPAYLGYFVGTEKDSGATANVLARLVRGLIVGLTVSSSFVLVFGLAGLLITQFSVRIQDYASWFTLVVGAALIPVGVAMVRGWEPTISVPRFQRGGQDRNLASMFLFGVSYATVSLGCTLPIFLGAVSTTFDRTSFVSGMAVFLAYAAGMGLVLMVLTGAVSLAQGSIVTRMRGVLPYVHRVSGAMLIVGGVYVTYYGWTELQIEAGNDTGQGGPIQWFTDRSSAVANFVQETGATTVGTGLVAIIGAAVLAAWIVSRRDVATEPEPR